MEQEEAAARLNETREWTDKRRGTIQKNCERGGGRGVLLLWALFISLCLLCPSPSLSLSLLLHTHIATPLPHSPTHQRCCSLLSLSPPLPFRTRACTIAEIDMFCINHCTHTSSYGTLLLHAPTHHPLLPASPILPPPSSPPRLYSCKN